MAMQTTQFNIGNRYWTYLLQPNYLNPYDTSPSWWEEHVLNMGNSIQIDPGNTILIRSLELGQLVSIPYIINNISVISLYGIVIDYFNPNNMEGLPTEYLYATVTNLGQQSIEINYSDTLFYITTFGLPQARLY